MVNNATERNRVVLYGPPGTGKTTNLTRKIQQFLDKGIDPKRIAIVSFTKAAAKTMAERVDNSRIQIGTTHSMCFKLTGLSRDQVIGKEQLKEISAITHIPISGAGAGLEDADKLEEGDDYMALYELSHARCDLSPLHTYDKSHRPHSRSRFQKFCVAYEMYKKEYGFVDFTDMLSNALDYDGPDVDVLFVDEAQDLSSLQWKVIKHWIKSIPYVVVAGDDDQAIFVWGGANPHGMADFAAEENATEVVLDQSYRIPRNVHAIAGRILRKIPNRVPKVYKPMEKIGTVHRIGHHSSIKFNHGDDIYVLYRNHSLRKDVETALIERGLPYKTENGKPSLLQMPSAKVARILSNMREEPTDANLSSLFKAYTKLLKRWLKWSMYASFERGDFDAVRRTLSTANIYLNLNVPYESIRYYSMVDRMYGIDVMPTIRLSTIHGSKGDEADTVVLINDMSHRSAESMMLDPDAEYRTFYVGVTRAKNTLYILNGDNPLLEIA